MSLFPSDPDDWLNIRLDSIADLTDKLDECRFFLVLSRREKNREKFRWLLSAFFGAAYSYFEISALRAYIEYSNPETGQPLENAEALEVLRTYVTVFQDAKNPEYVKTGGKHPLVKKLYEYRRANTHHHPLLLMKVGDDVPREFHLGSVQGKGVPALEFCDLVIALMNELEAKLGWNVKS